MLRDVRTIVEPIAREASSIIAHRSVRARSPRLWIAAQRADLITTGTDRLASAMTPRLLRAARSMGFATAVSLSADATALIEASLEQRARVFQIPVGHIPLLPHLQQAMERECGWRPTVQFTFRNISSRAISPSLSIVSLLDLIPLEYGPPYCSAASRERLRRKYRRILQHAAAVVALSQSSLNAAREALDLPLENAFLALPVSDATPATRRRTLADLVDGAADSPYLLVHGGTEPRKNCVTVVRAHRRLSLELRQRFPLVVVGGLWGGRSLATIDLSGGDPYIHHVTYLDNSTYNDAFGSARIILCPSTHEGFGLPALDAMQSGVPVLISNIMAHREAVGVDGIPPLVVDAWAAAITEALTVPGAATRMRDHGLERAREFTLERMASGYEQALQHVRRLFRP